MRLWGNSLSLFGPDSAATNAEFAGAMWLFAVVGPMWLLLLAALILWWRRGRRSLWKKVLTADSLLWLGVFLFLLLPWKPTGSFLVPAPTVGSAVDLKPRP